MWKHRKRALCLIALAVAASAVWGAASLSAPPPDKGKGGDSDSGYTVVSLDPNPNSTHSWAVSINDSGEIVGAIDGQAVYWKVDVEGNVVSLNDLTGGAHASDINNHGEIVGQGSVPVGGPKTGLYWQDFTDQYPIVLPPLDGDGESRARAINDNGLVVGLSGPDVGGTAVAWQINFDTNGDPFAAGPVPLDDDAISESSRAHDVNNAGQAVGLSEVAEVDYRAVRWQGDVIEVDGVVTPVVTDRFDLSQVGGGSWEGATAINELGDIVGWGVNSDGEHQRGFFYDGLTGDVRELASLSGRDAAWGPSGINDAAKVEVVGTIHVYYSHFQTTAVLWKGDRVTDLSKKTGGSDWAYIHQANDVNQAGVIVGSGGIKAGEERACLLIPK